MLKTAAKVHFIGIGGIGMSALAQVLLSMGYIVSGSDLVRNHIIDVIESKGGKVYQGHKKSNIGDAQIAVYSSSIAYDNPELQEAKRRKLQILHRSQLLAQLMEEKEGVAITGAHGKTTTASMIADVLIKAGLDPICILGGESFRINGNAYVGKGDYLIAEADESDGTHTLLKPKFGIITNIDREHLDYYGELENILKSNSIFLQRIKPEGAFFGLIDDELIRRLLLHYDRKFVTFGFSDKADLYATNIKMQGERSMFNCVYKNRNLGQIEIRIPGRHNILNALATVLFSLYIGIQFDIIKIALGEFRPAKRRFEIYPDTNGIILVEDYAHHPTEIYATLEACRLLNPKRIITVFQPHRYTRTAKLQKEFGPSFRLSDILILTNIYSANEAPIEGVSVKNIYDSVINSGYEEVHIMPQENIVDYLYNNHREGDLIAVLGAGDIGNVAKELSQKLRDEKRLS